MYCKKCGKVVGQGDKFCTNCGTPIFPESGIQSNFNNNPQYPMQTNRSEAAFAVGVILLIAGIIGILISGAIIAGDIADYNRGWGFYNYGNDLGSHEIQMLVILFTSILGGFIGLIMTLANRRR